LPFCAQREWRTAFSIGDRSVLIGIPTVAHFCAQRE
jgi:hypothetical protein